MKNDIFISVLVFFAENKWFTALGAAFWQIDNNSIYSIWNIQASNFPLVPYLKCFGTSQLEFEAVELYWHKV